MYNYLLRLLSSKDYEKKTPVSVECMDEMYKITINGNITFDELKNYLISFLDKRLIENIPKEILLTSNYLEQIIYLIINKECLLGFSALFNVTNNEYFVFCNSLGNLNDVRISVTQPLFSLVSTVPSFYTLKVINDRNDRAYNHNVIGENTLKRAEAVKILKELLNRLEQSSYNFDLDKFYSAVNIVRTYNPIIIDDELALSLQNASKDDLDSLGNAKFDIVLHETKECVGYIDFDFNSRNFYFGNVSYAVNPAYRNLGYASRALKMLKEVVKTNNVADKSLFISVKQNNRYSEKVAVKNGGELYFSGQMPDDEFFISDNRNINIYRIKI